jgi:hypothetical protein
MTVLFGPCNRCGSREGRLVSKKDAERLNISTVNLDSEFLCFECYEKLAYPNKQTIEQMAVEFPTDDSVKETIRDYNKMRLSGMYLAADQRRKKFYGKA